MTLFEEADIAAAALRRQPKFVEEDLRIAFRQIQRRRLPDLSAEEFDALYGAWKDGHGGGRALERKAELERMPGTGCGCAGKARGADRSLANTDQHRS